MTLLAQHGTQKKDVIERALDEKIITGIVFSPVAANSDKLTEYLKLIQETYKDASLFFDPQFHYSQYNPFHHKNLTSYNYFQPNLSVNDFLSASKINTFATEVLNYQIEIGLKNIISPTVVIKTFQDRWALIARQLHVGAEEIIDKKKDKYSTYHSLVISENAFADESYNEFLDNLTTADATGFYICIDRNSEKPTRVIDPVTLSNILFFIYSLSEINKYEVILPYSDLISVLYHLMNIHGTACGWHSKLKYFSSSMYSEVKTGGRRPRARYTSAALLNSILINPDLVNLNKSGFSDRIISNTAYDSILAGDMGSKWTWDNGMMHHWAIIKFLIDEIDYNNSIESRTQSFIQKIDKSIKLYSEISSQKIVKEANLSYRHLSSWKAALKLFMGKINGL